MANLYHRNLPFGDETSHIPRKPASEKIRECCNVDEFRKLRLGNLFFHGEYRVSPCVCAIDLPSECEYPRCGTASLLGFMELPRFDGHLNFGGMPQKEGANRGPSDQISLRVQRGVSEAC